MRNLKISILTVVFAVVAGVAAYAQGVNYIPYYHLVNRAKFVKCIHADCDSAIAYYLQAFEKVDYVLQEDLQHFTQCAAMQGKDSLVYSAMDRCIAQTVPLSYIFLSDTLFDRYKNTEKWKECYAMEQENQEKYKEKYAIGVLYKKVLDSLLVSDQKVRNKWNAIRRAFPNSKKTKELIREGRIVDSCNQLVLDEMIVKYDYPNERNGCSNYSCMIREFLLLLHYRDTSFFNNIETKAFLEGKISPDCYAWKVREMTYIYKWNIKEYTYSYSKKRGKKMTPQEKEQVDKNRYEIGLLSVEEEKMIKQYNYTESKKSKKIKNK
ncbi:MAG: hypothetical protein FWH36_01640 [Lentimicrobiaceae bacterium]|nr:hypothetical protein [Lentimicrobiaceae bacterium]